MNKDKNTKSGKEEKILFFQKSKYFFQKSKYSNSFQNNKDGLIDDCGIPFD